MLKTMRKEAKIFVKIFEAKRSEKFEAKRSEKFEAKRSKKKRKIVLVSFAKQSENQAKRDAVSLFSLRSEKIKQAKMGHPSRPTDILTL